MKIKISLQVLNRLLAYAAATPDEFSGFGFCDRQGEDIFVYDFALLNVGSYSYTEIDPVKVLPLLEREDRKKMKVWIHRHPLGNGIPGLHNWSGRDEQTIQREPLGATPDAVNWSVSVVLTPGGFVGRIDNYLKGITQHLEVEPATVDLFAEVRGLSTARSTFQPRLSSDGNSFEEEDDSLYEEEDGYPDRGDDHPGISAALRSLIWEYDPGSVTLAEILEDYGIEWQREKKQQKQERWISR